MVVCAEPDFELAPHLKNMLGILLRLGHLHVDHELAAQFIHVSGAFCDGVEVSAPCTDRALHSGRAVYYIRGHPPLRRLAGSPAEMIPRALLPLPIILVVLLLQKNR